MKRFRVATRAGNACTQGLSLAVQRRFLNSSIRPARLSKLFLPSGTISQSENEIETTTDLLLRAGYIRKSSAGIFSLLPLAMFVQQKITDIIHHNMQIIGGSEIVLPALLSPEAWKITGRWNNTELYKLKDSSKSDFLLAPTHEEEITSLVSHEISSFRQLPLRLYQIGKKYRDEKRPRGGMLRGREFFMMDLYTFDASQAAALKSYREVQEAYANIFDTIGIEYVVTDADAGSIGGDLSHEYHYVTSVGEDSLVRCNSCSYAANAEVALSYPSEEHKYDPDNVAVKYGITSDGTLLVMYHPTDRVINDNLIKREIPEYDLENRDPVETFKLNSDPMIQNMIRIFDERVPEQCSLPDLPVTVNIGNITTLKFPCVQVDLKTHPNEQCPKCEKGILNETRAVEVGHTFYLGTKYSDPLRFSFVDESNERSIVEMGCFGIGVSRLLSVIAEVTRDEHGLRWPAAVCPYEAVIVPKPNSKEVEDASIKLLEELHGHSCEVVIDDRVGKSFGWKLGDAKFLGFPINIVIGNKFLKSKKVDIEVRRTGKHIEADIEEAALIISEILKYERKQKWTTH
ncbi:hypothetical protein V1511DRAFT_500894 [Dipodascopsis uninucleata]